MDNNSQILEALEPILTRLSLLESSSSPQIKEYANLDALKVLSNGISSFNQEDLIDQLYHLLNRIEDIYSRLNDIYPISAFNDIYLPGERFFDPKILHEPASVERDKTVQIAQTELDVYKQHLGRLIESANKHLNSLGTKKFANAGFLLQLDLSSRDIAILFNAMRNIGFISKTPDKQLQSKKVVYEFMSKNILNKDGKPIRTGTLKNSEGKNVGKNTTVLQKYVEALLEHISES
jgi:hypothetical protein